MENVKCNLCNLDDIRILFSKRDKFGISDEEFKVVECRGCGLLYVNPRPSQEEMGRFYPETYSWKETLGARSFLARRLRGLEKNYRYHLLRDEIAKVIKCTGRNSGKVLDVGCGTGDRLDVLRSHGFETFGVETSESADYAQGTLGLNIRKGDLLAARFPDRFFDLITLYHVLEHTHNPRRVCEEIHRILKDDGILVIQVPNKESMQYQLFKRRWVAFDVPRDLYYFGTKTLEGLLQKSGFHVFKTGHFMNWWHPPTLVPSLFPNLDPQKAWDKEGKGGSTVVQRVEWILCTLMAGPFTQWESLMGRGAIVTCYAGKESAQALG
jgi:SAM-dependent methyltransferase